MNYKVRKPMYKPLELNLSKLKSTSVIWKTKEVNNSQIYPAISDKQPMKPKKSILN